MHLAISQHKGKKWKRGQYLMVLTILMNLITVWSYYALPRKSGRLERPDLNTQHVHNGIEQPPLRLEVKNDLKSVHQDESPFSCEFSIVIELA